MDTGSAWPTCPTRQCSGIARHSGNAIGDPVHTLHFTRDTGERLRRASLAWLGRDVRDRRAALRTAARRAGRRRACDRGSGDARLPARGGRVARRVPRVRAAAAPGAGAGVGGVGAVLAGSVSGRGRSMACTIP